MARPVIVSNKLVSLPRDVVDRIFAESKDQVEVALTLYRWVIPRFARIKETHGWSRVNRKTAEYLMARAIEFDKEHHPGVMAGGLWMDKGFSSEGHDVPDWMVKPCEVTYHEIVERYAASP